MRKSLYILFGLILIFGQTLFGNIINIPDDYPTIQEGLNMANTGDTVLVAAGTYYENIIWPETNEIKLIGSGEDNCIIDGNSLARVIYFGQDLNGIIDSSTLITGFTIQNGNSPCGGGIFFYNSEPNLVNLRITDNSAVSSGGGIMCFNYSDVNFENVIFTNNSAGSEGGALCCDFSSDATLTNVIITDNESISGCGGGISSEGGSIVVVSYSLITGNSAVYGGGVFCGEKGGCNLINCTIVNNSASDDGGGVGSYYYSWEVVNCILWNNFPNQITGDVGISYSNIQGGCAGIGNIDADPLFIDPLNGDYHLSWANFPIPDSTMSPCIDAGDPTSPQDPDGTIAYMGAFYFDQTIVATDYNNPNNIVSSGLFQNYPNPFKNSTTISFSLKEQSKVKLSIYNIKGELVATLINEEMYPHNNHQIIWNGKSGNNDLANGIYFYKLSIGNTVVDIKKCLLLK